MNIHFTKARAALAALALVATSLPALAHEYTVGSLHIGHPWARATPPGAKVAGGYLTIRNDGTEADRLVSVTSELSDKGEIHEMKVDDKGVMTMRPIAVGIEIPAGGEVKLEPGGYHLMFQNITKPAKEGVKFKGTLTFEKAGSVDVDYAVEPIGGKPGAKAEDHSGHGAGGEDHSNH